jgi:hypothetical protein
MEKLYDLLQPGADQLRTRESQEQGIYVEGLSQQIVRSEQEIMELIGRGEANRSVASTAYNERSSRSHRSVPFWDSLVILPPLDSHSSELCWCDSVFMLTAEQRNLTDNTVLVGKLNLVDLAGSERVSRSGATGGTLEEAKHINESLHVLNHVISALTTPGTFVPYRDSSLTRILQDSLGGNTKTSLVVNISAHPMHAFETLSSLRFGARAKRIKNRVQVNVKRSPEELAAELTAMQQYVQELLSHIKQLEVGKTPGKAVPPPRTPIPSSSPTGTPSLTYGTGIAPPSSPSPSVMSTTSSGASNGVRRPGSSPPSSSSPATKSPSMAFGSRASSSSTSGKRGSTSSNVSGAAAITARSPRGSMGIARSRSPARGGNRPPSRNGNATPPLSSQPKEPPPERLAEPLSQSFRRQISRGVDEEMMRFSERLLDTLRPLDQCTKALSQPLLALEPVVAAAASGVDAIVNEPLVFRQKQDAHLTRCCQEFRHHHQQLVASLRSVSEVVAPHNEGLAAGLLCIMFAPHHCPLSCSSSLIEQCLK